MDFDLSQLVDIRLLSVERRGNSLIVERELVFADGSTIPGKHAMPSDVLEWRAAEYGIDPEDLDTLLDMVLWEPFLPPDEEPELSLHQAPTIDEAREHHLARIAARKGAGKPAMRGLMAGVVKPDPVREQIKALAVMDPEALALKTELTHRVREEVQETIQRATKSRLRSLMGTPSPEPPDDRIERLRGALMGYRGNAQPSFDRTPTFKEINRRG